MNFIYGRFFIYFMALALGIYHPLAGIFLHFCDYHFVGFFSLCSSIKCGNMESKYFKKDSSILPREVICNLI